MDATLTVFESRGLAGLSMAAVAKAAGVATGTIYTYFDDKAALVRAVHAAIRMGSARRMREAKPTRDRYPERLRAYVEAYFDDALAHEREFAFLDQFKRSPYVRPEDHSAVIEAFRFLLNIIGDGVREGFLSEAAPEAHLYCMDGVIRAMVAYRTNADGPLAEARDGAWTYTWRAIKA